MLYLTLGIALVLLSFVVSSTDVSAHKDGCHSKHSCPSDSGSYTCGDTRYCSQCPDNQYCKAGKSIDASSISVAPKKLLSQKINSSLCTGNTMCLVGVVRSVTDGDTIIVDTYKIRMSLTNTPEKGEPNYSEATRFTKSLCNNGSIAIVDQDDKQPFDRYKRLVGKVYCSDKNVNSELLENGLAKISKKYCKTSEFATESWATKFGC